MKRYNLFLIILYFSSASLLLSCIENNNESSDIKPVDDVFALVYEVLQSIDVRLNKNILIISRFACHSCFQDVIERARMENNPKSVHIIILGQTLPEVKRLNVIYKRFNLGFLFVDENILVRLMESNPELAHTIFLGLKVDHNGVINYYDGKEDYDDIEQRTNAVIDFLFN